MSRIPQPPSSRNTTRTPGKASSSRVVGASSARKPPPSPTPGGRTLRTQSSLKSVKPPPTPQKSPAGRAAKLADDDQANAFRATPVSIREQIALRRAEARKATAKGAGSLSPLDDLTALEDALPIRSKGTEEDMVDLGRWSIKETIERARTTGALNLASRSLPCLPSALFEIHLAITPEPLKSVPEEPPITASSSDETSTSRRRAGSQNAPSWYEAQDLEVLKAWSNEILEIQPEISMFGSLKNVDLHNNKLTTLPDSFADLTALTSLDISHNEISTLPVNIWALPNLTSLNLSHNALISLPFFSPFSPADSNPLSRTRDPRGDWYSESITRATVPLPKLVFLDVSCNRLTATSIHHEPGQLPASLVKLNVSSNPLGHASSLIKALSRLEKLAEVDVQHAHIGDDSFPVNSFSEAYTPFPVLSVLDLGETHVTRPAIEACLLPQILKRTLEFEYTPESPRPGVLRVLVGKRVIKEVWELEAERRPRIRGRLLSQTENDSATVNQRRDPTRAGMKEQWELEVELGLHTEGAKRRARAASNTPSLAVSSISAREANDLSTGPPEVPPKVVEKEPWEIEAEQGLMTEGGRRRARAAAAAATAPSITLSTPPYTPSPPSSTPATSPIPTASVLSNPQYYSAATHTLTLPASAPLSKISHARSFSLAAKITLSSSTSDLALAIPTATLPLAMIASQPLSHTLKSLILSGRRVDPSFCLPAEAEGPFLPLLEELNLENCNLGDKVTVSAASDACGPDTSAPRTHESLLTLLARLFPSVRTLDLSYNGLTSGSLSEEALSQIVFAETSPEGSSIRSGLRQLRLRGNRLTALDGFQALAGQFKGNRHVPGWKLEELDLRDNEIGKLPPELGLLPMDVFLVDGNVFRVPARRVWEREGTKGLLSWLRGRIE